MKLRKVLSQKVTNGMTTAWSPLLKIKEIVGHAGRSLQLELWSPTGTFLEKERTLPSLNNNLLTVQVLLTITDAMVGFLPTPSNTLDTMEVLSPIRLILMLPKPINV